MADNSFCIFVSEVESCQLNHNPYMQKGDYDKKDGDMKGDMKEDIMEASIYFTMTVLMNSAMIAASLFRFRSIATYLYSCEVLSTNQLLEAI